MEFAEPSSANLVVDGAATPLTAYIIDEQHYFKLRDIAFLLKDTGRKFAVDWDEATKTASLTSGEQYTVIGGEMSAIAAGARPYAPTSSSIFFNGTEQEYEVYLIDNSNYFKLRDLADPIGFKVDWVQETQTVIIDTKTSDDANGANPPGTAPRGDLVTLFSGVIGSLIATDLFMDTSIEVLAFDLMELKSLNTDDKQSLLRSIHDSYGFVTIEAAIDELYTQGRISSGIPFFEKGLLFTFTNLETLSDDSFVFSISIWRGSQSTNVFVDYIAERAADGTWGFTGDMELAA